MEFLSFYLKPSSLDSYFYLHFIAVLHVFYYKSLQNFSLEMNKYKYEKSE